jgi:hypothetical protein
MYNWFQIESESQHRRLEWERAVAAESQTAQVHTEQRVPLSHTSLSGLSLKWLAAQGMSLIGSIASRTSTTKLNSTVQPYRAT